MMDAMMGVPGRTASRPHPKKHQSRRFIYIYIYICMPDAAVELYKQRVRFSSIILIGGLETSLRDASNLGSLDGQMER